MREFIFDIGRFYVIFSVQAEEKTSDVAAWKMQPITQTITANLFTLKEGS